MFAGIVRAPMTSILIIFEMTDGYGLILPLMIANMSSFALARHWRPISIYHVLLLQDGIHLHPVDKETRLEQQMSLRMPQNSKTPQATSQASMPRQLSPPSLRSGCRG